MCSWPKWLCRRYSWLFGANYSASTVGIIMNFCDSYIHTYPPFSLLSHLILTIQNHYQSDSSIQRIKSITRFSSTCFYSGRWHMGPFLYMLTYPRAQVVKEFWKFIVEYKQPNPTTHLFLFKPMAARVFL